MPQSPHPHPGSAQSTVDQRLARLGAGPRARAIAASLPWCDRDELCALAQAALDLPPKHQSEGVVDAMLGCWGDLEPTLRSAVVAMWRDRVAAGVERLAGSSVASQSAAAAALLADPSVPSPPRFPTLARMLAGSRDPRTLSEATDALVALLEGGAEAAADRRSIDEALVGAASAYAHHGRDEVFDMILARVGRPSGALAEYLHREEESSHAALRRAMRRMPSRRAVGMAIGWLAWRACRGPALGLLDGAVDTDALGDVWARAHLAALRGRGARLAQVRRPAKLLPGEGGWRALGARDALDAERLSRGLALGAGAQLDIARELIFHDDPRVRGAGVRKLGAMAASRESDEALREAALDRDPRVACAAVSQLAGARTARRRLASAALLRSLRDAPHPATRVFAREALAQIEPRVESAGRWWCPLSEIELRSVDPGRLVQMLGDALRSGDRARVLWAIGAAERVGLLGAVESWVVGCLESGDAHVASRAARALGGLTSHRAACALDDATRHPEARVRANALEASWRARRPHLKITDHLGDVEPRVVASAVRLCLKREPGGAGGLGALDALLSDERPMARRSGLWVCKRLRVTSRIGRVAHLAREDDDAGVAWAASVTARRLSAAAKDAAHGTRARGDLVA